MSSTELDLKHPVMLFDGHCFFCNGMCNFIIRFEFSPQLRFAPLQSKAGMLLLNNAGRQDIVNGQDYGSFVIVDKDGKAHTHFGAVIQMFRFMGGVWSVFGRVCYWLVPNFLGNAIYSLGWRYRYNVMGKSETGCVVPTKALRARLVAGADEF